VFDRGMHGPLFRPIDRSYEREGPCAIILAINVASSFWDEFLVADAALLCAFEGKFDKVLSS
jgi:hypothetical protein